MSNLFQSLGHGWATQKGTGHEMMVTRTPMVFGAIETVITEWLCAATGHRLCNSALVQWGARLADKHTQEFRFPASDDTIKAYSAWMGWGTPFWCDDEDEEEAG